MNGKTVAIIVAVIIIIGIGWYLAQPGDEPEVTTTREAPGQQLPPEAPPTGEVGVVERTVDPAPQVAVPPPPTLEQSDDVARSAAADLAVKLAAWMKPEEQVRKWVLLMDMVADGKVPARNRPLSYPMSGFKAQPGEEAGAFRFDESNFGRTGDLIEVLVSIPPQKAVEYYRAWRPLLEQAYADLGKSDSFDERVHAAIERVLAVNPLESAPELARPNVFYTYADPSLEKASDLEKLMWRLGPENLTRLQNYLREVQAQL
jgi:hypothetical protein